MAFLSPDDASYSDASVSDPPFSESSSSLDGDRRDGG